MTERREGWSGSGRSGRLDLLDAHTVSAGILFGAISFSGRPKKLELYRRRAKASVPFLIFFDCSRTLYCLLRRRRSSRSLFFVSTRQSQWTKWSVVLSILSARAD